MSEERIRSLSRVGGKRKKESFDSVLERRSFGSSRAFDVLFEAQKCYDNLDTFRRDRERNKNYSYGRQWDDIINDDGKYKSEEEYIKEQGRVPLTNNLIRRLVRKVVGVYRNQSKEPICTARDRDEQKLGETMTTVLQCNMQKNRMNEVYPRSLEEYLISGFIAHRKWFGWRNHQLDCWTDYVQPNNFFIDGNMRDFRGWDCRMVGEIHDLALETVLATYAENEDDVRWLRDIYATARAHSRGYITEYYEKFGGRHRMSNVDFLMPTDPSRCRVIEVWRKEVKPRYRCHDYNTGYSFVIDEEDLQTQVLDVNARRLQLGKMKGMNEEDISLITYRWCMDEYWYYYHLTPFGHILREGETPYEHKSHPYVFKAYPFIDGEIHSFVSDVIDQQRYVNRLITMYDWIMSASAKGVLLFPEECLPEGYDLEDVADEWHRFDGVIAISTKKLKEGAMLPRQISSNSTNIGITDLLNIQLKFFEDISGVNGVLQGKPSFSGESGEHAQVMEQNATTSLVDLLESFGMFTIDAAYKDVKNMQQYYDSKRVFNISGKAGSQVEYDPKKLRDVELDLSIVESTATPAYRQMANSFLLDIWRTGQISLQQLLEHGDFPFSDDLLQSIKSQEEQIEQGKTPDGLSPAMMQQAQQNANMENVNRAHQMLRNPSGFANKVA